jgi:hypothetical protein
MENQIISKLKEFGIEVYNVYADKKNVNEIVITAEKVTIAVNKNEAFLNFHITAKPSYAARIILILQTIKKIKFYIGEEFLVDENGKFIDGQEAEEYQKEYQKKLTISQFMDQQQQLYYLTNAKSYTC